MSRSDRERVEGFHRTIVSAVTQTPDDSIAAVFLTPPQPPALLVATLLRYSSLARYVSRPSRGSGTLDGARHGGWSGVLGLFDRRSGYHQNRLLRRV